MNTLVSLEVDVNQWVEIFYKVDKEVSIYAFIEEYEGHWLIENGWCVSCHKPVSDEDTSNSNVFITYHFKDDCQKMNFIMKWL
jgi:hypothetical protein